MTTETIRKCDGCGISDDVRKVNDYRIQVYRNSRYINRSTIFQLCNQCDSTKINLALSTVKAKILERRGYRAPKEEKTVFQRAVIDIKS